jgi:hypothetical protein
MKLTFYNRPGREAMIRTAQPKRAWMDATFESFAYRCLPLSIANAHGWEILSPATFAAVWDGSEGQGGVKIVSDDDPTLLPASHFGHGILTFYTHGVFRTEPGWDLWVTGPPNTFRDGLAPLTGVVETDWLNASFTMNWRFTRPDVPVLFELGEPFCFVFPVRRGLLEQVECEMRELAEEPELLRSFTAWGTSRDQHNVEKQAEGTEAAREKWQKDYYQGRNVEGPDGPPDHKIKLRLKPF